MSRSHLVLAALATLGFTGAAAATTCGDRDEIVKMLRKTHGEHLAGRGMQSDANLFEVWMSDDSGSWTILRTEASGKACIVAAGTHWLPGLPEPRGVKG